MIISIEGVDKVGKSVFTLYLSAFLYQKKIKHSCFYEPYFFKNRISKTKNEKERYLLINLSRFYLLQKINKNHINIFDRYIFSTIAYQILTLKIDSLDNFLKFTEKNIFCNQNFYPDLTIIIYNHRYKQRILSDTHNIYNLKILEEVEKNYRLIPSFFPELKFIEFEFKDESLEEFENLSSLILQHLPSSSQ